MTNDSDNLRARLEAVLGHGYTVERELTPGGMSRLFLATERSLNRSVVVKVLPPEAMYSVAEDRFRREAELLARLQHPHIVPVLSVGWTQGLAYYVMPFVEGESLATRLTHGGLLDVDRSIELIREIADALGHAHSLGVIHRDVKPANVLLAAGHAVVTDFGIARSDASHVARLTNAGLGLGTIGYMAPEQVVEASEVDSRADVFALGVVGYEVLTGRSPFATSGEASLLVPQLRARPAHPSTLRAEIPRNVGDALLKALEPDPNARFATMEEFRGALPRMPGAVGRLGGRRWLVASVVAVAAVSLFAIFWPRHGNENEASESSRAIAPSPQGQTKGGTPDRAIVSVAVAPFDVMRGDLAIWREGMVDVLSRNLDGMGDLRTISPSTILQSWQGRSDPASAARLGKLVHAQWVIYGALRADGDSVRAQATVYDMTTGKSIGEVERGDAAGRIDRLADSLTVEIVRAMGGPRGSSRPHLGSVGTRSMPALKAFLQGEQYLRRGHFDTATALFRRAAEIDTGFALAYHRLAWMNAWAFKFAEAAAAERQAVLRNHGLSEHDSLVIAVGALGTEALAPKAHITELGAKAVREFRSAMERYPADAELQYRYADFVRHSLSHEIAPTSAREQLELFDKAITADAGSGEAYIHGLELAMLSRDVGRLEKYFRGLERIPDNASGSQVFRWFAGPHGRDDKDCQRWADTVGFTPLHAVVFQVVLSHWVDSSGSVARCLEKLALKPGRPRPDNPEERVELIAAPIVRSRGLLSRADALDPNRASKGAISDYAYLAMQGAFDADSVAARARPAATDASPGAAETRRDLWLFWAWRKDTATLTMALLAERALREKRPGFSPEEADRAVNDLHDALFAIVRGDTARAVGVLERAPQAPRQIELAFRQSVLPVLYERTGRLREARVLLDRPLDTTPLQAIFRELRVGQLSERLGDRERAATAFSLVIDALRDAEPRFAPFVREALDGLRRTGDSRAVVR